jgi:hypothetical protein
LPLALGPGLVGGDERLDVLDEVRRHLTLLLEGLEHPGEGEDGVEAEVVALEPGLAALLAVDENDDILNLEANLVEGLDGLHDGGAGGDEVLDDEAGLSGGEGALDGLLGSVVLHLLAPHEHRAVVVQAHARRDGEGGVGHAAHVVELRAVRLEHVPHAPGDGGEHVGVGHDHPEVDVDGAHDAGLELELAKLDSLDLVQAQDEGVDLVLVDGHGSRSVQ